MALLSVEIIAESVAKLRALERYDLDLKTRAARMLASGRASVPGVLTPEQVTRLESEGYEVRVVADLDQVAAERAMEVSGVDRLAGLRSLKDAQLRAVGGGYLTPAEVESALGTLQLTDPGLVTLIDLPEPTWEGRHCRAIRVRGGTTTARPGVLFTGSMHAREWGGSDVCIRFATKLIDAYAANAGLAYGGRSFPASQVRAIVENLDVFIFPDVNPDGKQRSQTVDRWWRKNRNPNTTTGPGTPGVDLNRNFDFLWSSGIGTSTNPGSEVYRGTGPFSEPESRNVSWLLDTYPNIRYLVDIHSYGGLILFPWGDDDDQPLDPAQNFANPAYDGQRGVVGSGYGEFIANLDLRTVANLATRMNQALSAVRGVSYTVQQSVGLYPTSGTVDDYAFSRRFADPGRQQVYSFTIEFGEEFIPPFVEMEQIIADVSAALTEFCWAVAGDVYVRDNAADSGEVPARGAFWDSPDIWVRNRDDGGTAHENTIRGQDNFVYARISNRGAGEAKEVVARLCLSQWAGTEFVHPGDWIPRNPGGGGGITASGTYLIGEAAIPSLAPGASQVVSVRWPAALVPPATHWHPCLLLEVAPADGPSPTGSYVWDGNNLAQKNLTIVDARPGDLVEFPFRCGSPFSRGGARELVVRRLKAPAQAAVYLDIGGATPIRRPAVTGFEPMEVEGKTLMLLTAPRAGRLRGIRLQPGQTVDLTLRVAVSPGAVPGEGYRYEVAQYDGRRRAMGGVVLQVNVGE